MIYIYTYIYICIYSTYMYIMRYVCMYRCVSLLHFIYVWFLHFPTAKKIENTNHHNSSFEIKNKFLLNFEAPSY